MDVCKCWSYQTSVIEGLFVLFFFLRFYLFIHERQREREAEGKGEAGSPQSREPKVGPIPGSRNHHLSQRQTLNPLSHPGVPVIEFSYGGGGNLI